MASNQMFFLEHFVKNYSGKDFTEESLMKDEVIARFIGPVSVPEELVEHAKELQEKNVKKSPKKSVKQEKPKKSEKQEKPKKETSPRKKSLEDRSNEGVNHGKCLCRLWKNGLDNIQCSGNKIDGTDFCKRHSEFGADWWCGLITEPRPEEPVGPSSKPVEDRSRHYWNDQEKPSKKKKPVEKKEKKPVEKKPVEKKPVEKKEKKSVEKKEKKQVDNKSSNQSDEPKKKKRGRPKKEVEEKVEEKVEDTEDPDIKIAGGVGDIPETSNESTEDKVENIEDDDEETAEELSESDEENEDIEETSDFEIDGVIYKRLVKDDMVIDWKTGTQMAYITNGKFTEFFTEEAKKLHENYKK